MDKSIQLVLSRLACRRRVRACLLARRIARRLWLMAFRWWGLFVSFHPAKKTPDHGYIGRNHTKSCIEEGRSKTAYRSSRMVTDCSTTAIVLHIVITRFNHIAPGAINLLPFRCLKSRASLSVAHTFLIWNGYRSLVSAALSFSLRAAMRFGPEIVGSPLAFASWR